MYGVMYLEGDSISTLKYSMLYLDSDVCYFELDIILGFTYYISFGRMCLTGKRKPHHVYAWAGYISGHVYPQTLLKLEANIFKFVAPFKNLKCLKFHVNDLLEDYSNEM